MREIPKEVLIRFNVLIRHPESKNIDKITDKVDKSYSFSVSGVCRTYTVSCEE